MAANVLLPPVGTGDSGKSAETREVSTGIHRQIVQIGNRATPSSVLTRPADTTAYAANDLVANSTTARTVTVPSFAATPYALGTGAIRRARLLTNKTSGMDTI